ncbi:MAG: hypothetical protein IIA99_02020 [Proteobacteria bacterium]|nr:hypothetical protein [Pseudomonadota bacterium]
MSSEKIAGMRFLVHRIRDEPVDGALVIKMNSGTRRVRHLGALFLRTFFLGMQKEGTRRLKAESALKSTIISKRLLTLMLLLTNDNYTKSKSRLN